MNPSGSTTRLIGSRNAIVAGLAALVVGGAGGAIGVRVTGSAAGSEPGAGLPAVVVLRAVPAALHIPVVTQVTAVPGLHALPTPAVSRTSTRVNPSSSGTSTPRTTKPSSPTPSGCSFC